MGQSPCSRSGIFQFHRFHRLILSKGPQSCGGRLRLRMDRSKYIDPEPGRVTVPYRQRVKATRLNIRLENTDHAAAAFYVGLRYAQ
jgi:hypothetical protein